MPLVGLLNVCYGQDEKGLPPTPDTWHLGCSYHLHSSHRFLSTWGAVMLETKTDKQKKHRKEFSRVLSCHVAVSSE